ncbi:crotonase/enoyl-CoA hydratase family protein [Verticiella sediminum]
MAGSSPNSSIIELSASEGVADIRLNRPEVLNAFSDDSVRALVSALRQVDRRPDLNVAVLSGNGRSFSSGADVRQRQLRSREELIALGGPEGDGAKCADIFTQSVNWKPVVAAVHGYAIGMGLGVALSCDLIVAEDGTQFQVTETLRGLSSVRYMEMLKMRGSGSFAIDVTLTGRWFSAQEALAAGVIDRVVAQGSAYQEAHRIARQIADHPPLGIRASVRSRRMALDAAERRAAAQTDALKLHLTEDFSESARAFVEKRQHVPYKGQ